MTEEAVAELEPEVLEEEVQVEEADEVVDSDQTEVESVEAEAEEESVEITLGDESLTSTEEEKAPDWVRDLRKSNKEVKKQNRELQKRLEEMNEAKQPEPTSLGKKPKLEDFDFDTERFEGATDEWYATKKKVDEQNAVQEAAVQQQNQEWQDKLSAYESSKGELGVADYQDSEDVALETFDQTQQGILLQGSDNPALAIYAIGKNPQRAKELASITDPVKFAFAVAKLESQLKVTKKKARPAPEQTLSGSTSTSGVDSTLQRLEAEALKTNNYTKVFAYEKKLKAKSKQQS